MRKRGLREKRGSVRKFGERDGLNCTNPHCCYSDLKNAVRF